MKFNLINGNIITLDNANPDIKIEAQKKLNRDFSE